MEKYEISMKLLRKEIRNADEQMKKFVENIEELTVKLYNAEEAVKCWRKTRDNALLEIDKLERLSGGSDSSKEEKKNG